MKITDIEVNESIELGDNFDIELGNTIIESRVVGFTDDGVVLEADDKALALLGISGALLESVDITEVSLGDYSKKAQISRALAQIDQKFYPDKPGSEQTIAKRTRGLERAKVRNDQARAKYAAQAQQDRADAIAKDRENLPTLEKYLAQLKAEFDPNYEYSDDHSVWTKNRELKAKISDLERRIKNAKGVAEGSENLSIGQQMAKDGITYSPEKENVLIDLMSQYMKKAGMSSKAIRYYLSYDEDFIPDQLSELPRQGLSEGKVDIKLDSSVRATRELLYNYDEEYDVQKFLDWARDSGADTIKNAIRLGTKVNWRDPSMERMYPGALDGWERLSDIVQYNPYTDNAVAEGSMKEQMHTDAERMELAEFLDKYGNEEWVKEFWHNINDDINEAKYQGREVPLGKPMAGDVKKSKVYVRGPKGNVVKVNFGDKNMRIKKSNPKRRKSFRARHNCANPGPRWKARYWSCRAW